MPAEISVIGDPTAPVELLPDLTDAKRIEQRELRRQNKPDHIDNSSLYAGSPMYYYCRDCGWLAVILPEAHREAPPRLCLECQYLMALDQSALADHTG